MESGANNTHLRVSFNFRDTELSVIQNGEAIWRGRYSFGAVDWILTIIIQMRFDYDLLIGRPTAEQILLQLGTTVPRAIKVKGRNLKNGLPTSFDITSEDLYALIGDGQGLAQQIAHSLRVDPPAEGVIMIPPPVPVEFRAAISQQPIELTGEFGRISGIAQRLEEATGLKVILSETIA